MDHLVYVASSGAGQAMLAQAANSNNLANASTAGFRADLILAQTAQLAGEQAESRAYTSLYGTGINFREGSVNVTGGDLDVAINGEGWIAVAEVDGTRGVSRRGDLRINEVGQLLDGAGRQILGDSGPIALPDYSHVSIGSDGTVTIVPLGEDPNSVTEVDRIKLVKPDKAELVRGANGLIQMRSGEEPVADAGVTLITGSLESSNVDSVGSLVQMIELAREFEYHTKMMKVAEELDAASAELISLN